MFLNALVLINFVFLRCPPFYFIDKQQLTKVARIFRLYNALLQEIHGIFYILSQNGRHIHSFDVIVQKQLISKDYRNAIFVAMDLIFVSGATQTK